MVLEIKLIFNLINNLKNKNMNNLIIYRIILICFSFATCVMLIKYEILPLFICFTFFFLEFLLTFKK